MTLLILVPKIRHFTVFYFSTLHLTKMLSNVKEEPVKLLEAYQNHPYTTSLEQYISD